MKTHNEVTSDYIRCLFRYPSCTSISESTHKVERFPCYAWMLTARANHHQRLCVHPELPNFVKVAWGNVTANGHALLIFPSKVSIAVRVGTRQILKDIGARGQARFALLMQATAKGRRLPWLQDKRRHLLSHGSMADCVRHCRKKGPACFACKHQCVWRTVEEVRHCNNTR